MRPAAVALLLALVAGCSVWNRPDPFDGGAADAPVDTPDAGADAPDGPLPRPRETVCDDGRDDEDLDGLIDCADPDCASNVALCCRESRPAAVIDEDWCGGVPSSWRGVGALTATDLAAPCSLSGDDRVAALLNGGCVPVPSGLVIEATLAWSGSCPDCEAMVALSPIRDVPAGGLLEELALRMREDDQTNVVVELTRAGRVLGRLPAPGTSFGAGDVSLTLSLFPALDDEGRPVIRATLRAVWDDGMRSAELDALDALAPRDLTGPALGCSVAPGLFLGVQTRGRAGRIGELLAWPQQCSNPALFRPAGFPAGVPADASWFEASDLGFPPAPATAWTAGGVGAATSVPLRTDATVVDWHWFVDGTNLNRANDRDRALDFSFGGSFAPHPGLIGFTPRRGGAPLAGHLAPTCVVTGSDCGVYDFREPALFVPREPDGSRAGGGTAYAVWVSRADDGSSWLGRAAFTEFPNSADTLSSMPLPIDTGCAAPSHPAILSPDPSGDDGHLLVFVCGAEVWGLRVDAVFAPLGEAAMLFEAGTLGFPLGILDVDGAVFDRTYRLWVAGRDGRGVTRLAITEARIRDDGPLEFVPFGGNPVLSIDDPIFQTGPDRCVGVCRITGVGVAREPGAMDSTRWGPRVRVLVSVTDEGASVRHAVVPLEQWMP